MSDTPTDSWFVNDLSAHLLTCQHQLNELLAENDRLREALERIARCAGSGTLADMARAALAKEAGQ